MRYALILTIFTLGTFIYAIDLPKSDPVDYYDPATLSIDTTINNYMPFLFRKINGTTTLLLMFDWRNLEYIEQLLNNAKNEHKLVAISWAKVVFLSYSSSERNGDFRLMPFSDIESRIYATNN